MTSISGINLNTNCTVKTSSTTKNNVCFKSNSQKDIFTISKKENKKKTFVGISILAVISALAVGGILFAKKGKISPKLQEASSQVKAGIKTFTNSAGAKVDGINLVKGKAIASDGSMFSGIMETVTKSGKKVSLEYKDGFITQSKIDGKLFKKFENITIPERFGGNGSVLTRKQGVKITKFDNDKFKEMAEHVYYDNGKIKRAANETRAIDFFPNGKIQAQEVRTISTLENGYIPKSLSEYTELCSGKIFNNNGNLITEIINDKDGLKIIKHLDDGSKVKLSGINYANKETLSSINPTVNKKFTSARKAKFFDTNGKQIDEIFANWENGREKIGSMNARDHMFLGVDNDGKNLIGNVVLNGTVCSIDENGISALIKKGQELVEPTQKEKESIIKNGIKYFKDKISTAKEHNIDYADKISTLFDELLSKNGLS